MGERRQGGVDNRKEGILVEILLFLVGFYLFCFEMSVWKYDVLQIWWLSFWKTNKKNWSVRSVRSKEFPDDNAQNVQNQFHNLQTNHLQNG